MKNYFFLLLILLMIIVSCQSKQLISPDYASGIKNIKHNLERKSIDLFQAYIETKVLIEKGSQDQKSAHLFLEEIVDQMKEEALDQLDKKEYEKALHYLLSLKTLNIADIDTDLKNCFNQMLKGKVKEQTSDQIEYIAPDIFSKNYLKEKMAELGLLNEKELYQILNYYYQQTNTSMFKHKLDQYSAVHPGLLKKYPQLLNMSKELETVKRNEFEKLMPTVLTIIVDKGMRPAPGGFTPDISIGTGFFIDENGHILTNHHIIADHVDPEYEGYSKIYATLYNDQDSKIPVEVIGYDKVLDLALLKISRQNTPYLILGRSENVKIGKKVFTIGNPLGISYTVTSGIISNKELDFFQLGQAVMIDAAINPGNSGGPLLDERGHVIGIVFAGIPQYEGINFAIPFQWIRSTLPLLFKGGEVKRSWIGASLYHDKIRQQIMVHYVIPATSAAMAGLQEGDVLLKVNHKKINQLTDVQLNLAWEIYPRFINLEIKRGSQTKTIMVKTEKRPYLPVELAFKKDTQGRLMNLIFGIKLDYYDKKLRSRKYVISDIYKGMVGAKIFDLEIGDPVIIHELKMNKKNKSIILYMRYLRKDLDVFERGIGIEIPAGINTII